MKLAIFDYKLLSIGLQILASETNKSNVNLLLIIIIFDPRILFLVTFMLGGLQ